jgi:pilus assembly protein CpaE
MNPVSDMDSRSISGAVVSDDRAFRDTVQAALDGGHLGVALRAEVAAPYEAIDTAQLQRLREADPQLVFLDLGDDATTAIRFAHFLAESNPSRRFIAAGSHVSAELLLEAMRAGVVEYLPKPVVPEALTAAVERAARKLRGEARSGGASAAPREPGKLLAVFSAKGGSGSTTIATNLAIHLHQLTGKRTLLLDLDLELGEVAVFLSMQPRFNFVDLIRNFHRMDAELLASYIERHESGVHLLSAPFHPERAESVPGDAFRKVLRFLQQHYDYIVVDTPKSFTPATIATLELADTIHLVTTVDLPSLRNIKRSMPLLTRLAPREKVRLVVNRYQADDLISLQEVERTLGMSVDWKLANDYEAVIQAINSGSPVAQNASSRFSRDLKGLAAEIGGLGTYANGHRSRLGPLRKLFARSTPAPTASAATEAAAS